MKTKLTKKRAISTVLTTVIILVASVVLGSGVVLYGTSLFQGSTQTEAIAVSTPSVWVHTTASEGLAWGAAGVRNTGDKVLSVDKISIRGFDIPFAQWYADTSVSAALYQQVLNHSGWDDSVTSGFIFNNGTCSDGEALQFDLGATEDFCADAATGPISLTPGQSAIIY
ncbi:MAG: hypothetical protein IIC15_05900, partial [Thaumarchaeota archaeon]|nr:hypothetical protein [Nitrososphaerota archaeon]